MTESAMRSDDPVFVFGSLLEQGRFGAANFDPSFLNSPPPLRSNRASVNVRYAIFDQRRRFDAGRFDVEAADAGAHDVAQQLRLETLRRFYGVSLAEAKRDVAADAIRSAESRARTIRDKFEQGLVVESDLLATEVQLAEFRQRRIEAEGDLAIARAALATLLQRPIVSEMATDGAMPERIAPAPPLQESIDRGVASRGDLRIAHAAAANATLAVRTARGSLLPRVDALASWSSTRGNPDHTIGLFATLDLFDGAKLARVAEARAGAEEAKAAENAARDAVTMDIVAAWHRADAARQRVGVASKAVEQAEAAARIVRDRYQHGLTTITEQLRADTALVSARLGLLAARYDAVIGRAELLRATGGLNDVEEF
jgi:outer membrane protein TolC